MKKLISLMIIAALFTLGSFAHPPEAGKRGDKLAESLQLTDEQRTSVDAIMETVHARMVEIRDLDREQQREARQLLHQDLRSDMAAVLTPEQFAKFDDIKAKRAKRHRKHSAKNGKRGDRLAEALLLNDDQKVSVKAIMESNRGRMKELRDLDREQRHDAMQLVHQDIRSELSAVLTPEQLAKFDDMRANRANRHRKHRGNYDPHAETDTL